MPVRFPFRSAAILAAALLLSPTATAAPSGSVDHQPFVAPAKRLMGNDLSAVDALAPNDVWRIGNVRRKGEMAKGRVRHFDGTAWTRVRCPNPGLVSTRLTSVDALAPDDVWIVGDYVNTTPDGEGFTYIAHWDGSTCSQVDSPNQGEYGSYLQAVTALSPTNAWAVGGSSTSPPAQGRSHTLIEHWNGTRWRIVESPNVEGADINGLSSVGALSSDDIWAVGGTYVYGSGDEQTLAAHWDGASWTIVPSANPWEGGQHLNDVVTLAPDDVWAVGFLENPSKALAEHWDGHEWVVVPAPQPQAASELRSVSAVAADDIWAVGGSYRTTSGFRSHALIEHWDGSAWAVVPSPDRDGSKHNVAYGVSADSESDAWAVGDAFVNDKSRALSLHWDGTAWATGAIPAG